MFIPVHFSNYYQTASLTCGYTQTKCYRCSQLHLHCRTERGKPTCVMCEEAEEMCHYPPSLASNVRFQPPTYFSALAPTDHATYLRLFSASVVEAHLANKRRQDAVIQDLIRLETEASEQIASTIQTLAELLARRSGCSQTSKTVPEVGFDAQSSVSKSNHHPAPPRGTKRTRTPTSKYPSAGKKPRLRS
jgi:hypothetical protein